MSETAILQNNKPDTTGAFASKLKLKPEKTYGCVPSKHHILSTPLILNASRTLSLEFCDTSMEMVKNDFKGIAGDTTETSIHT
jgi:hypothetical protein